MWSVFDNMIIIKYFRTLLEKQDGSDDELLAAGDEDINVSYLVFSPGLGNCVVFFGKTLYSHSTSLHPGEFNDVG